ncbi:MAG: hypothetical protein NTW80_05190 [Deltaproteobacteria bacterium]|nr:hypothetical protein [Deltaproteobacteria bacterium]
MGQVIAGATPEGDLIAVDSRAVMFEPLGEERFIILDRVVPVSFHAVLASAGAIGAPFHYVTITKAGIFKT